MPPRCAHVPKATMTLDFARNRWARCSFSEFRIAAVEQGHIDVPVRHGFHVRVLEIRRNRPENDVRRGGNVQNFLVRVEDGHIAPPAGSRPVRCQL